jgi:hypothetical protein
MISKMQGMEKRQQCSRVRGRDIAIRHVTEEEEEENGAHAKFHIGYYCTPRNT